MDPNQHHNALNRHDMLHWYEIQAILGQGGFGITYLAKDTNLDQLVAIKEYLPSEFSTRDKQNTVQPISENHTEIFDWGKKRFLDEAKTLAQFRHPNVVRVNSFFENNNTGYMVMEYEEGSELAAMIKAGTVFGEQELLDVLLPILDGLEQIHAQGFIHRDIKPANIFIRNDGSPVLIDFGSARQAIGGQTKTMTSLVTPGFAPFEQYHDAEGKQGPWTDIYALGATCYSMITGKPPIDALKRGMARLDHSTDAYLQLSDLSAGKYSETLLRAIDHALEFKETDRPQSVTVWRAMLLGESAVPQSEIETRIDPAAATKIAPDTNIETTQKVTGPGAATVTSVDTEPMTQAAPAPATPVAKSGRTRAVLIVAAAIVVILLALVLQPEQAEVSPPQAEVAEAAPAPAAPEKQVDTETLEEQARLQAEREALQNEQARIAAEKAALQQEQAAIEQEKQRQERTRLEAEKKALQQEQARIAAEKKRLQQAQAQKKAAEKKRREELAKQQAEKKRKAEQARLEQSAQAIAGLDLSGVYRPDRGFDELHLKQRGNKVTGWIGSSINKLNGVIEGNQIRFSFHYTGANPGGYTGEGRLEIRNQGKRLVGKRSDLGIFPDDNWGLTRIEGAITASGAQDYFADLSGVYLPDEGYEDLVIFQNGNKIRGEIGTNGSTLEGTRRGNKITFVMKYSITGYGFQDGYGQFIVSADGKRLSGTRSKAGFKKNSSWNLTRNTEN